MRALNGSGTGGVKRGDRRVAHGRVGSSSEVSSFEVFHILFLLTVDIVIVFSFVVWYSGKRQLRFLKR
jgi:hypothetical protein